MISPLLANCLFPSSAPRFLLEEGNKLVEPTWVCALDLQIATHERDITSLISLPELRQNSFFCRHRDVSLFSPGQLSRCDADDASAIEFEVEGDLAVFGI